MSRMRIKNEVDRDLEREARKAKRKEEKEAAIRMAKKRIAALEAQRRARAVQREAEKIFRESNPRGEVDVVDVQPLSAEVAE
jgi:hypothetical protein